MSRLKTAGVDGGLSTPKRFFSTKTFIRGIKRKAWASFGVLNRVASVGPAPLICCEQDDCFLLTFMSARVSAVPLGNCEFVANLSICTPYGRVLEVCTQYTHGSRIPSSIGVVSTLKERPFSPWVYSFPLLGCTHSTSKSNFSLLHLP